MARAYSSSFLIYFLRGTLLSMLMLSQSMANLYLNMSDFYLAKDSKLNYSHNSQIQSSFISPSSQIRLPDPATPQHSRISNLQIGNIQYIPKIVQSGYIVGPPVAYTSNPNLPLTYTPFSPHKPKQSFIIQPANGHRLSPHHSRSTTPSKIANAPTIHFVTSESRPPSQPQILVSPPRPVQVPMCETRQQSVPKIQYERCVNECKNWQTKYNELYLKYMNQSGQNYQQQLQRIKEENFRLRQRVREYDGRQRKGDSSMVVLKEVIEKYKQSALKEVYLLLDRYRLECKHNEK